MLTSTYDDRPIVIRLAVAFSARPPAHTATPMHPHLPHRPRSAEVLAAAIARRWHAGSAGRPAARVVSSGSGWRILDVLCTCDRSDRVEDEYHSHHSIAFVLAGAFRYRGERGAANLAAGSVLLGDAGRGFRCWHDHGTGDRCLAVQFEPATFAELRSALGARGDGDGLSRVALPVMSDTTELFAMAEALARGGPIDAEQGLAVATTMAERTLRLVLSVPAPRIVADRSDLGRIADVIRWIESDPAARHDLAGLAARCHMSRFHFLRRFREATGFTPYAFIRRARLRDAAVLLRSGGVSIARVALEVGFEDLSTFHAAFRRQFGTTPGRYRLDRGSAGATTV